MTKIGLDIGGANLKAVFLPEPGHQDARAVEVPFPMWTNRAELASALQDIINQVDPTNQRSKIAVTMTGELADCFSSKKEGVAYIADSVREIAGAKRVAFYQVDGDWSDYKSVEENWQLVAASNWHAMARVGARFLPKQTGLIVDVGSTTTDVIPVVDGEPKTIGSDDFTRLKNFELIYAGIGRTPVCSLIQSVEVQGRRIPLARELFATIGDALIYTGLLPEDPSDTNTADGRSNSKAAAEHRLARMVCSNVAEIENGVVSSIATEAIEAYRLLLIDALENVLKRYGDSIESVLLVGSGSFLAGRILEERYPKLSRVVLSDLLSQPVNVCGPAYAVAALL